MRCANEIRANYDMQTIVVYQAYPCSISEPALKAQHFVFPFSLNRMTWIKPSFLWLMERSNWAQKPGQENILAVRIKRDGWDKALKLGVLTGYEKAIHGTPKIWQTQFDNAIVHVQWDPERSLRGADLGYNSIQVGLSRHIIQEYVEDWVVDIQNCTSLVRKIHFLLKTGRADKAKKLLPLERPYLVCLETAKRLGIK
jgi:hypothetical protein